MTFYGPAEATLRKTTYEAAIKQIASYSYKFKQLVSVVSGGSWNNYFFREQLTIPTAAGNSAVKGIPRGSEFPQASISWERVLTTIKKYGLEDSIPYEDLISNEIDVKDRTLIRIAEGVAKAVDDEIHSVLFNDSGIQSGTLQAGYWNQSSAAIVKDIAKMKAQVKAYYNNVDNMAIVVHPDNEVNILSYVYEKGAQAPQLANTTAMNGSIGKLAGVEIITSTSMEASYALLVVPQRCATWKELLALGTDVEERKFKDIKITACEMGVTQVTDPKAIVKLQVLA